MPANQRRACACSAFCKLLLILASLYLASVAQACTPTATLHCVQAGDGAGNDVFVPKSVNVNLGDQVVWSENATQAFDEHSSISGTCVVNTFNCTPVAGWNTGTILLSQDSAPVTFNSAGLHNYYCGPHGGFMLGSVTVNKGTASVVLSSLPPSTTYGQSITFTATVSSGIVAPTGTVNFVDSVFGTVATAIISGGVATTTIATVPVGSYNVFASYSGDSNFVASTSAGVQPLTVNPANTSIVMNSVSGTSLAGQSVNFTATVSNLDTSLTPTGNVNFTDNGPVVATIPPDVNGMAVWTTTTLPAGSNSITASFHDPNGNFNDSGPTTPPTMHTVQDYLLNISNPTLTATPGQSATYNGTLTALGGFNAFVTLSCTAGGTLPPSPCNPSPTPLKPTASPSAAFTLTVQNAVVNDFSFNIVGSGVANLPNRQQPVTFVVSNFALGTPSPTSVSSVQGNPSNPTSFTVSSQGSFAGAVNLGCTGAGNTALPTGVSCNFSQNPVPLDPGKSVTVTVTVGTMLATPTGALSIEIHGNGLASPAAPITLNVSAGSGSFDLSVTAFNHNNTPNPVMVGGTLEFDATVTVCPTSTCSGTATTTLVVDFDSPAKVISAVGSPPFTSCPVSGSVVTCTGSIASGQSATATIKVAAPFQRTLTATAQVSSTSADPTPVNNVRPDTALIRVRPLARKGLVPKQP